MPATLPTKTLFVQVAIPSPLRTLFDYLPPKNKSHNMIQVGSRVIVPFGARQMVAIIVAISQQSDVPPNKLKRIVSVLDSLPLIGIDIMTLCRWAANYYHYSLGETLMLTLPKALRQGKIIPIQTIKYWQLVEALPSKNKLKPSKKQLEIITLLNKSVGHTLRESILLEAGTTKRILQNLSKKGIIRPYEEEKVAGKFYAQPFQEPEQIFTLNNEQKNAIDEILANIHHYHPVLLDGITGSGKTEVYLQLIAATLAVGKQALVLIPEISLTPQTIKRFKQRFQIPVVNLHSGLSDGERLHSWYQATTETAGIIIATRSGIFTPLPSLGLIIVDEEHDLSYKQQDTLRYNARDLAIYRAKQTNCPVVLGSATPSLESWHNARNGRFQHLMLRKRAGDALPPQMQLLDMRHQVLTDGIAPEVVNRIALELSHDNQVMIFLNRRGYAPSVICHECGTVIDCPHCDAYMTLHRFPPYMHCHHCCFQMPIPNKCSSCKSPNIQPVGQGTEKAEQTLTQLFPSHPIIRIDRDSTRKKNALSDMLNAINKGKPCILLGTQMLAKGHHFPKVTLVIILNADSGLFSSDFRGLERTGQLIMQVAGRAGRGRQPGQVIIQTYNPAHSALQTLISNDYSLYIQSLLKERYQLKLPPFLYLAMVRVEARQSNACKALLQIIKQFIDQQPESDQLQLLGPLPAPMEKRKDRFRWQLFMQSNKRASMHRSIHQLINYLEKKKLPNYVRWSIDIDPQDIT